MYKKRTFSKKKCEKFWQKKKKCVPLQPQNEKDGSLAQLNRASDYGSEGCGFESRGSHKKTKHCNSIVWFFCIVIASRVKRFWPKAKILCSISQKAFVYAAARYR